MSDNNQKNNDDAYEAIFSEERKEKNKDSFILEDTTLDSSLSNSSAGVKQISGDMVDVKFEDNRDIESDEDFQSSFDDDAQDDIEEGIFAPQRSVRVKRKKSFLLYSGIAVVAIVTVLGAVYILNPLGKGITDTENASMMSNDVAVADGLFIQEALETQDLGTLTQPSPNYEVERPSQQPEAMVLPPAQIDQNHDMDVVSKEEQTQQVERDVFEGGDPSQVKESSDTPFDTLVVQESVATQVDKHMDAGAIPNVAEQNVTVVEPDKSTSLDGAKDSIIKPDAAENKKLVALSPVDPNSQSEMVSPRLEKEVSDEKSTKSGGRQEINTKETSIPSTQEERDLADARLDKYFDSPKGKMLKDIPSPSLNPDKSNGESIIIVNKVVSRNSVHNAKSDSKAPFQVDVDNSVVAAKELAASRAMKLGRYDAAKEMYDDLYKINPKDGKVLLGRALLLQKMGSIDDAEDAYEDLLKQYPDNVEAVVNLAGLIRKEYPAIALSKLLDMHQRYPNNDILLGQLGLTYADTGNYQDALRLLQLAITTSPNTAVHYFNSAVVLEKSGQTQKAIQYYEKSLEIDSIYGSEKNAIPRVAIYDRLATLRGR